MASKDERELFAEILAELRYVRSHTSRAAELLSSGVRNNVLESATWTIGATGQILRSWGTPAGSVEVENLGTADVTVAAGSSSGTAPTSGVGIAVVPAGSWRCIPIYDRQITIYGASGTRVGVRAYTTSVRGAGLIGVDGGTP